MTHQQALFRDFSDTLIYRQIACGLDDCGKPGDLSCGKYSYRFRLNTSLISAPQPDSIRTAVEISRERVGERERQADRQAGRKTDRRRNEKGTEGDGKRVRRRETQTNKQRERKKREKETETEKERVQKTRRRRTETETQSV